MSLNPLDSSSLVSVLGGRRAVTAHARHPLCAFQAGSTLVLWDFVKDKKKHVPLEAAWTISALRFTADCSVLIGTFFSIIYYIC